MNFPLPIQGKNYFCCFRLTCQGNLSQRGDGSRRRASRNGHLVPCSGNEVWVSSLRCINESSSLTELNWKSKLSRLLFIPHILRNVNLYIEYLTSALRARGSLSTDISLAGGLGESRGNRSSDKSKINSVLAHLLFFFVQNCSMLNWIFPAQGNKPNL